MRPPNVSYLLAGQASLRLSGDTCFALAKGQLACPNMRAVKQNRLEAEREIRQDFREPVCD